MKIRSLVLSIVFVLLFSTVSFAADYRPELPEFPENVKGKYYFLYQLPSSYGNGLWKLYVFDKKPTSVHPNSFAGYRLLSGTEFLNPYILVYNPYSPSLGWDSSGAQPNPGSHGLNINNYPPVPGTVYNNFPITLGDDGFFPYTPLPMTELAGLVMGETPVLVEVISLIPLLVPLLIGFLAFWKGWTWLKMQLLGV